MARTNAGRPSQIYQLRNQLDKKCIDNGASALPPNADVFWEKEEEASIALPNSFQGQLARVCSQPASSRLGESLVRPGIPGPDSARLSMLAGKLTFDAHEPPRRLSSIFLRE